MAVPGAALPSRITRLRSPSTLACADPERSPLRYETNGGCDWCVDTVSSVTGGYRLPVPGEPGVANASSTQSRRASVSTR